MMEIASRRPHNIGANNSGRINASKNPGDGQHVAFTISITVNRRFSDDTTTLRRR